MPSQHKTPLLLELSQVGSIFLSLHLSYFSYYFATNSTSFKVSLKTLMCCLHNPAITEIDAMQHIKKNTYTESVFWKTLGM